MRIGKSEYKRSGVVLVAGAGVPSESSVSAKEVTSLLAQNNSESGPFVVTILVEILGIESVPRKTSAQKVRFSQPPPPPHLCRISNLSKLKIIIAIVPGAFVY